MIELLTPPQIEAAARRAGKTMRMVCADAGIAVSTWTRWKFGKHEPRLDIYRRLVCAAQADAPDAGAQKRPDAEAA